MFDHVGVRVADLEASERFYGTVLSALGVEPSHADAELVEWDDWAIGPPDGEQLRGCGLEDVRAPLSHGSKNGKPSSDSRSPKRDRGFLEE